MAANLADRRAEAVGSQKLKELGGGQMEGCWRDYHQGGEYGHGPIIGATLLIPPLYRGDVRVDNERQAWVASINSREIGLGLSMEHARALVDYRIWNEVRQIRAPYKALIERRALWADANETHPKCLSLAVPGRYEPVFAPMGDGQWIGEEHCRDYRRRRGVQDYYDGIIQNNIRLVSPPRHQAPNLEPQDDINPSDPAPIFRIRNEGDGTEMIAARWWFMPRQQKGSFKEFRKRYATFNARTDRVALSPFFRESLVRRRCLIPADGWYEWTGDKYPKTKWLFTPMDGNWMCFAGIWDRVETTDEGTIDTFAIITHAAGDPLRRYHDRAPVVLPRIYWGKWLDPDNKEPLKLIGPESRDQFSVAYHSGPNPIG